MFAKNPFPGDEMDIPNEYKNRSCILWTRRNKGPAFHFKITYIYVQPGIPSTNIERAKPITVEELVKYEYFVSYDPLTYLTVAISGTVSIVYPVAGQAQDQCSMGSFLGPTYMIHSDTQNRIWMEWIGDFIFKANYASTKAFFGRYEALGVGNYGCSFRKRSLR